MTINTNAYAPKIPSHMDGIALQFILKIAKATQMAEIATELELIIAPLGITAIASGLVSGPKAASGKPFHFTNWSEAWVARYMESGFLQVDPLPRWARSSGRAITWSELFRILPPRDAGRMVIEAAASFGYIEGMAIPVRADDNALGLVAFGSGRQIIPPIEQAFLAIVGRAAFEAAERIERGSDIGRVAPIMTEREIECLTLLVQGHSDRDIASILGVSEPTVRFHIGNAREKTGAVSRTHMAALAVIQGYASFSASAA